MKFTGTERFEFTETMSRHESGLPDVEMEVLVDPSERLVTIFLSEIDSALVLRLAARILPNDHGVEVFHDDISGTPPWPPGSPPDAPYGLRLHFDHRYLRAHVIRSESGALALRIESAAVERQRLATDSASRVLKELHAAGIEAYVVGSVGRGEPAHLATDLDVFVCGRSDSDRAVHIEDIASAASTIPVDLAFENWITARGKELYLGDQHLAWDPVADISVVVPALDELA